MSTTGQTLFVTLLRAEFARRREKSPRFSQNRFAQLLGLSSPMLSRLMAGTRKPSVKTTHQIAARLKWSESTSQRVLLSLLEGSTPTKTVESLKANVEATVSMSELQIKELSKAQYDLISQWYHAALLELLELERVSHTPRALAKRLQIDEANLQGALRRLSLLKLIEKDGSRWRVTNKTRRVADVPSEAIRAFHRSHLQRAIGSLSSPRPEDRNVSGTTFSIALEDIPRVNDLIDKFRLSMMAFASKTGHKKNSIHHLTVSLMRLDRGDI